MTIDFRHVHEVNIHVDPDVLRVLGAIAHLFAHVEEKLNHMATKADLDAVIAALPAKIEAAVEAAVKPIIDAINAKSGDVDLSQEIDALNAVGDTVAAQVKTDLTPAA